jgi:hypothetical protein
MAALLLPLLLRSGSSLTLRQLLHFYAPAALRQLSFCALAANFFFLLLLLKITRIGDVVRSNTELIDMSDLLNAVGDLCPLYNTE